MPTNYITRYYMRPNLTFLLLDNNDEVALSEIMNQYDLCGGDGLLCANQENIGSILDRILVYPYNRELFEQDAKAWLYRIKQMMNENAKYVEDIPDPQPK